MIIMFVLFQGKLIRHVLYKECILPLLYQKLFCMLCLTALLEYKTALLKYIDLLVLHDNLIYSSMIYCTSNQDL